MIMMRTEIMLFALALELVRQGVRSCSARISKLFGKGFEVVRQGVRSCSARASYSFDHLFQSSEVSRLLQ